MLIHHASMASPASSVLAASPDLEGKAPGAAGHGKGREATEAYKGRTIEPMHPRTLDIYAGRGLGLGLACMHSPTLKFTQRQPATPLTDQFSQRIC
jgi:hypothetical protein